MSKQKWTTDNIPDLSGKVIIVTGGNSGLGYESVKAFVGNRAKVIMTCRSLEKGTKAKEQILNTFPEGKIELGELNLSDLSSIKKFAADFKAKHDRLDILLNNAGIMMAPFSITKDGFENQFGTNHLGHFTLTGLLIDIITKTPGSRIVNVSSLAHKKGKFDFSNLLYDDGKSYDPMKAYQRSKLSNLLFTYELQRKLNSSKNTMVVAAHPGVSMTNLANHLKNTFMFKIFKAISGLITHSPAKGALPQIRAAVDPNVKPAEYYGPDGFNEMKGDPVVVQSTKASHDEEDARKLWEVSEKLTGLQYEFN